MRDIGQGEAAEDRGVQHLAGIFRRDCLGINVLHRLHRGRVPVHVGEHRQGVPRHDRVHFAVQRPHQDASGTFTGFIHIDMRIGPVTGYNRCIVDDRCRQVGVEIECHGDRQVRRRGADAGQQIPFAIVMLLRHHRAVKVEKQRIAALFDRFDDRFGAELDDRARCRSTGVGVRGNRKDQLGPFFLCNVDKGRDGIVRARVNTVRLITARRAIGRADAAEVGDRGRYR